PMEGLTDARISVHSALTTPGGCNVLTQYVVVLERDAAGALVSAHVGVPLVDQYLSYLTAIGRAPTSISSYAYDLVVFCRWLASAEPVDDLDAALRSLTTPQVFAYVDPTSRPRPAHRRPPPPPHYPTHHPH